MNNSASAARHCRLGRRRCCCRRRRRRRRLWCHSCSEAEAADRELFTLQTPRHFLLHSRREEAVRPSLCEGDKWREIMSGIMACLCPTWSVKNRRGVRGVRGVSSGYTPRKHELRFHVLLLASPAFYCHIELLRSGRGSWERSYNRT